MEYEEMEKLSLEESKRQTKHRREEGLNMIRPFTFDEKKMLWDGLREKEKTTSELLMEGFKEEQILRRIEEREDD
jgi:protein subunit release factor B